MLEEPATGKAVLEQSGSPTRTLKGERGVQEQHSGDPGTWPR